MLKERTGRKLKIPNKRTRKDVGKALGAMVIATKGNAGLIATTLTRRAAKGKLKAEKDSSGWVYWTE